MPGHAHEFEHFGHEDVNPIVAELAVSQARLEEKMGSLADKFSTLIEKLDPLITLVSDHDKALTVIATEKKMWKAFSKPAIIGLICIVALASGYKMNDLIHWIIAP